MANVFALIPARTGSKGIQFKNFTKLAGMTPFRRATGCAKEAGINQIVVSSDMDSNDGAWHCELWDTWLRCEPPLHTDTCAMIDVVKDVLARVPGDLDDLWLLVQPTQPLRTPEHLKAAIARLESEPDADSVVSVIELPRTHHPDWQATTARHTGRLLHGWARNAVRRQDLEPTYIRDGTVYAFRRRTVCEHGNIYGLIALPLIIPPEETCPLDTLSDWAEAERRLLAKESTPWAV